MKKFGGKILSVLLAACMMAAVFPVTAGASWDNTTADTAWYTADTTLTDFQISSAAELAGLASLVNSGTDFSGKTVRMTANIALNDTTGYTAWNTTPPVNTWTPIGDSSHAFKGVFDGGDYAVSGIYIDSGTSYAGLFGYVSGGTVKNLAITGSFIAGQNKIGGVAGYIDAGSTITGCSDTGNVAGTGNYIGGLVGAASGSAVTNCENTGSVGETGYYVGGVAGYLSGSTVSGSYNTGAVSGTGNLGGVVGGAAYSSTVTACYNKGTVIGLSGNVGGVAGYVTGSAVSNNYSTGAVTGTGNVGGVAGSVSGGALTNNYYLSGTAASGIGSGSGAAQMESMEEMKAAGFPVTLGAAFVQDVLLLNDGYPLHSWQGGSLSFAGGSGTASDPYLIGTAI